MSGGMISEQEVNHPIASIKIFFWLYVGIRGFSSTGLYLTVVDGCWLRDDGPLYDLSL
jgi:hypothetical protein